VEPGQVDRFPVVLGVSSPATETTPVLVAGGGQGNVSLALQCGQNNPDRHLSQGIAEGNYAFDMAINQGGTWSGQWAATFMSDPRVARSWRPSEPDKGVFTLYFYVSGEAAEGIRVREQEHIDDFTRAWDVSIGYLQWAVDQVEPAQDITAAVNELVRTLMESDLSYLIPADPTDLGSWGQRAVRVYADLCDHSKKRDDRREHSPASYQFDVDASNPQQKTITVQVVLKDAKGNSGAYVLPSEIDVVYGGGQLGGEGEGAEELPQAEIQSGDSVTWTQGAAELLNWRDSESEYYVDSALTNGPITELDLIKIEVNNGVQVHSVLDQTHVVLVMKIRGEDVYVKARASVLRHV
jgi:hypothetical protein